MTIPPRFLDEIRMRLPLSEVIGKRVKVTRAGREFKACCPFHHEKTPSFTINDQKQFYHCFGCGAHGDVIGFVMRHDNLSFPDAIETLAAQAGLQVPKADPREAKRAEKKKTLHSLMDQATRWMTEQLHKHENKDVLAYLQGRGMSDDILAGFRIGYAPEDGQALRTHLKREGYSDEDMLKVGLLKESSRRGGDLYIFFRDRVMFPVADKRGRVIAFGGRILPDHIRPPRPGRDFTPPKYINSPDSELFDKGRVLFAESLAREAVRDGTDIIVTEGYMDVIACHQAGFSGAVAPMGTAVTEEQIISLWSMGTEENRAPVLCFDGDNAGRRAADRACSRILPLLKPGRSFRFAFLPEGEDPDTFIRTRGRDGFQSVLDSAMSLFDFIWTSHTAGKTFETPESRAAVSKKLNEEIRVIAEKDVQAHYRQILNERISQEFFPRRNFSGRGKGGGGTRPQSPRKGGARPNSIKVRKPLRIPADFPARVVLVSVLNHPHIYSSVEEIVGNQEFQARDMNLFKQEVIMALEQNEDFDRKSLHKYLADKGFMKEMSDILSESVYVHASFCTPHADSAGVESRLIAWLKDVKERDWNEINRGWKHASSLEQEEKLREMVKMKVSTNH